MDKGFVLQTARKSVDAIGGGVDRTNSSPKDGTKLNLPINPNNEARQAMEPDVLNDEERNKFEKYFNITRNMLKNQFTKDYSPIDLVSLGSSAEYTNSDNTIQDFVQPKSSKKKPKKEKTSTLIPGYNDNTNASNLNNSTKQASPYVTNQHYLNTNDQLPINSNSQGPHSRSLSSNAEYDQFMSTRMVAPPDFQMMQNQNMNIWPQSHYWPSSYYPPLDPIMYPMNQHYGPQYDQSKNDVPSTFNFGMVPPFIEPYSSLFDPYFPLPMIQQQNLYNIPPDPYFSFAQEYLNANINPNPNIIPRGGYPPNAPK